MKLALVIVAVGTLLAGCATPQQAAQPVQDPRETIATAVATCATAIERIATTANGDAASKVAAVGAIERMCGQGGGMQMAMHQAPPAQPQSLGAMLWTAALQTADIVLRGYGIKTQRDVAISQSNNAAATTIAGYNAFQGMASAGFASNATIAGFIQAPAGTRYDVSGNANFGSGDFNHATTTGSYNPVTRTCNGGQGGNSGGTTGGAGGQAGGANC